ncbi:hypothetical protein JWS13_39005 [Rhodococcus pseudokoreensis]|uniref:Uncharacterized protein n=1 Tax=Rhodococcus pseudokoreensis TaxID=2811421 RepID=A0A974WA70_9NOCA|nr:hypothetical protein [Rhodococcus pseudokoreensis]QSE94168.1 hypothetical protein JWS13_39005 [Rhodococcus pseudokoreensis]
MADTLSPTEPCRSCRAPIVWAKTRLKLIPLDPEPSVHGTVAVNHQDGVLHAIVITKGQRRALNAAGRSLYLAHFVSCPHAGDWRKR